MKTGAAVKLERAEEDMLGKMVEAGLFQSKDEAARAAIIKPCPVSCVSWGQT